MQTQNRSRFRGIGIYGSSSGRNAGDAALIGGIMDGIDQALGRRLLYEIPTYCPDYIRYQYENRTRPMSMLPWHASVGMFGVPTVTSFRRCDLNLIYDNMLFDRKLWNPLFNYMPAVWALFCHLRRSGQLLGMYNVGCGPVGTPRGTSMLREIAQACDFITVRDQDSLQLLRQIGVTHERILVTADAALTVRPAPPERVDRILAEAAIDPSRETLAINVNSYIGSWSGTAKGSLDAESFVRTYAEALRAIVEELKVPLVFIATQHSDIEITQQVRRALGAGVTTHMISNRGYNHAEMKGVLGRMGFLFAMRLHANILATSMCTPAAALSFQKKVSSYYHELGLSQNVLSFDNFSAAALITQIKDGWSRRHEIRTHLEQRIPQLQRKSLVTAEIVKLLDQGASPDEAVAHGRTLLI